MVFKFAVLVHISGCAFYFLLPAYFLESNGGKVYCLTINFCVEFCVKSSMLTFSNLFR